jgi:hypothetical protein
VARIYRRLVPLRRLVVNLDDGSSFEGLLWKESGPLLALHSAVYHEPGTAGVPLDGVTLIERSRIKFVQAP